MEQPEIDKNLEENREAVRKDAQGLWKSITKFLSKLLDIRAEIDRVATVATIKADIPYRGATAWILICSIFIASIGLNANSTAVVIGAMLISPLMGPILGIGLSIATNDIETLRKSLINFGIMVALSVFTALLFFYIFPLREESSELLARTKPDIRDVLIAFFGGSALIIARTKKNTIGAVIFGVAIATALMPPLCTVGYGLSEGLIGNPKGWSFALGAMYLFIINSIFIALATFVILKLLRFPLTKYANAKRRKQVTRIATLFAIIVMVPAGFTFWNVIKESSFENAAKRFIQNELEALPNASYMKKYATYHYRRTGTSTIELISFGVEQIPESTLEVIEQRMKSYSSLENTQLVVNQSGSQYDYDTELKYLEAVRSRDSLVIANKDMLLDSLQRRLSRLERLSSSVIPFQEITKESKINYPSLETLIYSVSLVANDSTIDTLNSFKALWKNDARRREIEADRGKLYEWLKYRMHVDTLLLN